jgi:Fe-S-cluster containining protein
MINPCSICSAECCRNHYITVTIFDIIRISEKTGKKPREFAEFYPLRLINFDNDTVLEFHDDGFPQEHILCLKSHPCIFLEGKGCSVHDFAPSACKTYPRMINGRFNMRLCPFPSGLLFRVLGTDMPKDYADELREYKKIVSEWNRKKGKRNECMEFLINRARGPTV